MKIDTNRLEIVPLTPEQMKMWLNDLPALEKELCCHYKAEPMQGAFMDIVRAQCVAAEEDAARYYWHSFCFLIRKADRTVVGSAVFKDVPDESGEVEIGYGLGAEFEHRGYMTEAVAALCDWAFRQPGVSAVTAETEPDGIPSQKILLRCGFEEMWRGKATWFRLRK